MHYEKNVSDSGVIDFFETDRQRLLEYGITLTPALVINKRPYQGELKGDAIFR